MELKNGFKTLIFYSVIFSTFLFIFTSNVIAEELVDGDLTIEEGGQPYRATEEEQLILEIKDQALTKALKFRIDFYAEKGITFDTIKNLFPYGIDRIDFLEYLNGVNKKRDVNGKKEKSTLLIAPYQYDNKFYELSTHVNEYEKWIEDAKYNLQEETWLVAEKNEQNRNVYIGVDCCISEKSGKDLFRCNNVTKKGLTFFWIDTKRFYEERTSNNRFIEVWN